MLVNYSDSESDNEATPAPAPIPKPAAKPGFQASSGKIKVDLPSIRPEPGATAQTGDEPPAKRARIGGGGINSFLPAPKRTAQNAPKKGVSLKTSSEAAFSREMPEMPQYSEPVESSVRDVVEEKKEEPKLIGKATRFLPLSVSGKKKKKPVLPKLPPAVESGKKDVVEKVQEVEQPPKPKPKRSLFSVQQEETDLPPADPSESYEPITIPQDPAEPSQENYSQQIPQHQQQEDPNSLSSAASDLNLTPAQRRHLFGRNAPKDVSITHFNMDSEYANNEKMRQAGEVTEHRAVKAIAPGKHSLQQLINNAKTQKDGLEDAWAEGKRNRGEGASKYGWGK